MQQEDCFIDMTFSKFDDIEATPELIKVFEDAATISPNDIKELSYSQMLTLADQLCQWAAKTDREIEFSVMLLGMSKRFRHLAQIVGTDWAPPEPESLSLLGFMARNL